MGRFMLRTGKQTEGVDFFELALAKLEEYKDSSSLKLPSRLDMVYNVLMYHYEQRGDASKCVYYSTLSLRVDRYQEAPLEVLVRLLKADPNTAATQAYDFLARLYLFVNLKDKLFVLKTAMKLGYSELVEKIRLEMTEQEKGWLDGQEEFGK